MLATPRKARRTASARERLWFCAAWLFVALISGAPTLAAELYAAHFECCASECAGADDEGNCPPDCHYGACAKTISMMPQLGAQVQPPAVMPQAHASAMQLSAPSGVRGDVFHPPRA